MSVLSVTSSAEPSRFHTLFEGAATSATFGAGIGAVGGLGGALVCGTVAGGGKVVGNALKLGVNYYLCDVLPKRYQGWTKFFADKAIDVGVLALAGGVYDPTLGIGNHLVNAFFGQCGGELGAMGAESGCDRLKIGKDSLLRKGSKLLLGAAGAFVVVKGQHCLVDASKAFSDYVAKQYAKTQQQPIRWTVDVNVYCGDDVQKIKMDVFHQDD